MGAGAGAGGGTEQRGGGTVGQGWKVWSGGLFMGGWKCGGFIENQDHADDFVICADLATVGAPLGLGGNSSLAGLRKVLAPKPLTPIPYLYAVFQALKMHPKNRLSIFLAFVCLFCAEVAGQAIVELPVPDREQLRVEDKEYGDFRFSAPLSLNLEPAPAAAEYEHEAGNIHRWSAVITVPGAYGLALFLDRVALPDEGTIHIGEGDNLRVFDQASVSVLGRLFTGFLPGETVRITYRGPLPAGAPFRIFRADHVYRPELWDGGLAKGFGDANGCHLNANCPEGDSWEDEQSGTARITVVVEEGVGFCSGNLVNNTARDGRPLLLTGYHCQDGFTPLYDLWRTDFGYAFPGCADEAIEPVPDRSYTGVDFRAGRFETDFLLLEITAADFAAEDHFFAGWDRRDGDVSGPVRHFHHPQGDVQKVSITGTDGMSINPNFINWNSGRTTPAGHHFEAYFPTGTFEPGSSGSAFFDAARRIRGQLNGGNPSCTPGETEAFVGRLHLSWEEGDSVTTRLREWLDPLGTGTDTLNGESLITRRYVSGRVFADGGAPVEGATVRFATGEGTVTLVSDAAGRFRGERPPMATVFGVSGSYAGNGSLTEQVDVGDIITIRRHILGFDTLADVRLLAVDVNGSGTVRVSDITQITSVILDIANWGERPNWLVIPFGRPLDPLPANPVAPVGIQLQSAGLHELEVDFFVLKTGDASGG